MKQVNIEFEKVEIIPRKRELKEKWTIELEQELIALYGIYPDTNWTEIIKRRIKKLRKKRK